MSEPGRDPRLEGHVERELARQVEDLAMIVRKLVRYVPNDKQIKAKALDYLKRKGLQGSPLRSADHREECRETLGDDGRCEHCGWNANTRRYETVKEEAVLPQATPETREH